MLDHDVCLPRQVLFPFYYVFGALRIGRSSGHNIIVMVESEFWNSRNGGRLGGQTKISSKIHRSSPLKGDSGYPFFCQYRIDVCGGVSGEVTQVRRQITSTQTSHSGSFFLAACCGPWQSLQQADLVPDRLYCPKFSTVAASISHSGDLLGSVVLPLQPATSVQLAPLRLRVFSFFYYCPLVINTLLYFYSAWLAVRKRIVMMGVVPLGLSPAPNHVNNKSRIFCQPEFRKLRLLLAKLASKFGISGGIFTNKLDKLLVKKKTLSVSQELASQK